MPAETPLGTQPGLGTQPRYEAFGDLRVEIVKSLVINIGLVELSRREWNKVSRGTAEYQLQQMCNMKIFASMDKEMKQSHRL